jgi:hypothetical protein
MTKECDLQTDDGYKAMPLREVTSQPPSDSVQAKWVPKPVGARSFPGEEIIRLWGRFEGDS